MSQSYYQVGKAAVEGFIEDDCPRLAAALSFYAILSLPALLLGVLWCAGLLWDSDELRVSLTQQIEGLFGTKAASQVSTILDRGGLASGAGPAGVVSGVVLLFGASGVMLQLQAAMNKAWNVSAQTRTGLAKIIGIVIKRVFSFGMVVTISILLIISLIVSAAISLLGPKIAQIIPFIGSTTALSLIDFAAFLALLSLVIFAMFKVIPDAPVPNSAALQGALLTSVLFMAAKYILGWYLSYKDLGAAYGAAGSLVLVMVWVYLTALILLLGAELTQALSRASSSGRYSP